MKQGKSDAQVRAKNAQVRVEEAKKRAGCASKGVKNAQGIPRAQSASFRGAEVARGVRENDAQLRAAKVINTSRACVVCLHSSQSEYFDIPCSQTTGARTRTRGTAIRNREAYFAKWRVAKFGDDFDPIRVAVDEAVAAFSSGKSEAGQNSDRAIWLKIANRVGLDNFLDAFFQLTSEIRDLGHRDKSLRRPAASFQKLLNERFPLPKEGGAR